MTRPPETQDAQAPAVGVGELTRLLERVEACTGADREVGDDLLKALGYAYRRDWKDLWWYNPQTQHVIRGRAAEITASLDAALALVERVLPGSWIDLNGPRKYLHIPTPSPNRWRADCGSAGWGATPALALTAALLRALIASTQQKELEG